MNVFTVRSETEAKKSLDLLADADAVAVDTETTGLKAGKAKLLSVQFSDGENHILVPSSEGVSIKPFENIFSNDSITKIFHNARFDLPFLAAEGISVSNVYDTMLAEKVLTRGGDQSASLAETLYRYFAVDLDKSQRNKFGAGWSGKWTDEMVEYAMKDVAYLPELKRQQEAILEKLRERGRYEDALEKMLASLDL